MFFRPNFCSNCGEKIERAQWGVWTSRRFCQVCESEYKGQDLIPRVIVAIGIVTGVFGFGSYLKSGPGNAEATLTAMQPRQFAERQKGSRPSPTPDQGRDGAPAQVDQQIIAGQKGQAVTPPVVESRPPIVKTVSPEPGYFCGAETKKGTPCSRRVKGNVRCYQHPGMPAMLAADKLRIADAR